MSGNASVVLFLGGAVVDPAGVTHRPGGVLVREGRASAWGQADAMRRAHGGEAAVIERPGELLLPGLVNAHAHLELTSIGPRPYGGDFVGWVGMLREHWPGEGEAFAKVPEAAWFAEAARLGAQQSRAAGIEQVGDITRFAEVVAAQRGEGLAGVGYRELFGHGAPWDADALAQVRDGGAQGWQPHAPYSAGPAVFEAAASSEARVCTHLAETRDELRFVAQGDGPFLELLKSVGKWDASFGKHYGEGLSPVRWMEPYLRKARWLVAHCNYVSDDDIALLAETQTSVAYCPVASAYFGHEGHRYRDMLEAGVNVCLGTDSIVCQPPPEDPKNPQKSQPLGMLPQMRFLFRRDGTDPALLLRMATTNGRAAIRVGDEVTMLLAVAFDVTEAGDPLTQVLRGNAAATGIALGGCGTMPG